MASKAPVKPKKKKAGKKPIHNLVTELWNDFYKVKKTQDIGSDTHRMVLAGEAFMGAIERAKLNLYNIPPQLIREAMIHLYDGKPLVFTSKGMEFIICDPRTYAQMVGK